MIQNCSLTVGNNHIASNLICHLHELIQIFQPELEGDFIISAREGMRQVLERRVIG